MYTDKSETKERPWRPNMPHMNVRHFLVEFRKAKRGPELDFKICELLNIKHLDLPPPVSTDLRAAVAIIPNGWWWHLSHLEASVIPTCDAGPISNGAAYDEYGRPLSYKAMCWEKEDLALAVCEALLKAKYDLPDAFVVEASKRQTTQSRIDRIKGRMEVSMSLVDVNDTDDDEQDATESSTPHA